MPSILCLPAAARAATPWKNGGGITREVFKDPSSIGADAYRWRVSIAEVAQEGAFSKFPDYRRWICVIRGDGMRLEVADHSQILQPFEPYEFDGEAEATGALPFGPVSDLNLIFQPAALTASMRLVNGANEWHPCAGESVMLINVSEQPLACRTQDGMLKLAYLDAVLATESGALVLDAAAGAYACLQLNQK